MKIFIRPIVGMALVAACVFATAPLAQDVAVDADGDPIYEYQGPAYFGFVKDTDGASVPDASVKLAAKGRAPSVVRTNSVGAYRASFGKDVDADDVVISCEKKGFKQVRALRRTAPAAPRQIPIEIECTLAADASR
jgi:hypothetical protein